MIFLQWYIIGDCVCTPFENLLDCDDRTYHNGGNMSFIATFFIKILGENFTFYFFSCLPAMMISLAVYKIYNHHCI
jgi:hypothetical protein